MVLTLLGVMMEHQKLLIILSITFFLNPANNSCTYNPFTHNDQITENKIDGEVKLSDGTSPDSIFIWLEGFNIGTYTNQNGQFSLTLPPAEIQGLGTGYNGTFNLYYYLANYKMLLQPLSFVNGELNVNQEVISNDGKLHKIKILPKLLSIKTSISPSSIQFGQDTTLTVTAKLTSYDEYLRVESLRKPIYISGIPAIRTGLIFKPIDSPADSTIYYDYFDSFFHFDSLLAYQTITFNYEFDSNLINFSPGSYHVYPYLKIIQPNGSSEQEDVPEKLLDQIAPQIKVKGLYYRRLPMKRTDAVFTVNP